MTTWRIASALLLAFFSIACSRKPPNEAPGVPASHGGTPAGASIAVELPQPWSAMGLPTKGLAQVGE